MDSKEPDVPVSEQFSRKFNEHEVVTGGHNIIKAEKAYMEFASLYTLTLFFLKYFESLEDNDIGRYLRTNFVNFQKMLLKVYNLYQTYRDDDFISVTLDFHFDTKNNMDSNYYPKPEHLGRNGRRFTLGGSLQTIQRNTWYLITPMRLFRVQVVEAVNSLFKSDTRDPTNAVYYIGKKERTSPKFVDFVTEFMTIYNGVSKWSKNFESFDMKPVEEILNGARKLNAPVEKLEEPKIEETKSEPNNSQRVVQHIRFRPSKDLPKKALEIPVGAWSTGNPVSGFDAKKKLETKLEDEKNERKSHQQTYSRGRGTSRMRSTGI